jgi:hypothetical protein
VQDTNFLEERIKDLPAQIVSPDSKIDSSYTSGTGSDCNECFDAAVQWCSGKGVRDEKSSVMSVLMRRGAVKKRVIVGSVVKFQVAVVLNSAVKLIMAKILSGALDGDEI